MMTVKKMKFWCFALLFFLTVWKDGFAQDYQFAIGSNLSNYYLVNTQGVSVDFLKPGSGIHMNMRRRSALVDTLALISSGSEKGAYYKQHPSLAKVLSVLHYDFGLVYNQYNTNGGVQNIAFDYKTDFIGFNAGFGPEFNLSKGFKLGTKLELNAQKMLQGIQMLGSNYYDLGNNEQFSSVKFFGGYSLELIKQVNSSVAFFIKYQNQKTLISSKAETGKLDFSASTFAFGLNFKMTK
ncbi:hypothetical protein V7S79_12125 [Aquirufa sp. ROCK-SH2]